MSFLRNLFSRRSGTENGSAPAATLPPPEPELAKPEDAPATPPSPHAPLIDHAAASLPTPAPRPEDCIAFALKWITDHLPIDLKPAVRKHPSEHVLVRIPKALILPQLATGAVRITFAQLCSATPEIFFHADAVPPETKIALPLEPILQAVSPRRRPDQKPPAIPVNVPSVFSKSVTAAPERPAANGPAEPWYSHRRPSYDGPDIRPQNGDEIIEVVPEQDGKPAELRTSTVAPAPETPALKMEIPAPAAPASLAMPMPEPPDPAPALSIAVPAPDPAPQPAPEPATSSIATPKPEAPAPEPAPAGQPRSSTDRFAGFFSSCQPAPTPAAESAAPEPIPENSIAIPLPVLIDGFPNEIRSAIHGVDIAAHTVYIPQDQVEPQIRSGKLRFKWSEISAWCRPGRFQTAVADQDIDLPLAAIVPLFLAARKAPFVRKSFEIDSRIPDVFVKTPEAQAATESLAPAPERIKPVPEAEISVAPIPDFPEPAPAPAPVPVSMPEPPAPAFAPVPELRLERPGDESIPAPQPPPEVVSAPSFSLEPPAPECTPAPSLHLEEPAPAPPAAAAPVITPQPAPDDAPGPAPAPAISAVPDPDPAPARAARSTPPGAHGSTNILQRVRALNGVTGAFLATSDGLLIAADLPEANENIMAAFAPTVFAQLAKYSTMANLGLPESVDLHLSTATVHVRKAGKIFLGVLSRRGSTVPPAELNEITLTL